MDIHCHNGGFFLEGKYYTLHEAIDYLMGMGFNKKESSQYLLAIHEETQEEFLERITEEHRSYSKTF